LYNKQNKEVFILNLSELFWNASLEELKSGFKEERITIAVCSVVKRLRKGLSIPRREFSMRPGDIYDSTSRKPINRFLITSFIWIKN
jgi:hypothetical protein